MSSANARGKEPVKGVYFLASDGIYDLAVAFLNSFRASNPRIPLCLIPFDSGVERLLKLSNKYQFTVFSDGAALRRCDHISRVLYGRTAGHYRKLAAWEGEFDQFIYIDADTVVLRDVSSLFEHLEHFDMLVSQSPGNRRYVWRDSIDGTGALTADQIAYSANTGFLVSRKGALPLHQAEARLDSALALSPHMDSMRTEQPFLNYLIVTSEARYSSLSIISKQQNRRDIPVVIWAGARGGIISGGEIRFPQGPESPPVLLVHWAGMYQMWGLRRQLYHLFCRAFRRQERNVRPFMKYGRLWRHYRNLNPAAIGCESDLTR